MTERRSRVPDALTARLGVWVLAALTYLPALTAAPGRMPTDTKLYLYLDPGRLIADAPFTWDTRQFAGWVPHQTIAYLWPSGPWFWTFDQFGVPDWIAHRLWIGTILFLGGLGVRWAARHLGLAGAAASVAGVVYATSPYILPYVSRTSVMLLPWAAVGWLVGLTVRATVRTRWRDAALFALVVLTVGAVNATALALIAPAPVLWLVHAAWQRTISVRTAVVTAAKLGGLSLVVSLWWIAMLVVQGRHGADVLAFSETLEAVSLTSVSTETLRGLGYWLFYVRDPYAFTTTASIDYMASVKVILTGAVLLVVCLLGLALTRWTQRRYAALLVFTGIVLAVGVHPIADPSPVMRPLHESALGLALRSSTRAVPLSSFGLALGAGALVAAIGATRFRLRRLAAPAVGLLAVVNLPALWTGGYVDPALERDQDVPAAWRTAAAALDAGSTEHRVLQLPGSEFGAFRWGYTVDPPLPGLTTKPLVTRDLLPLGSPAAMDLLYALDNRFQTGTLDPDAIAPIARFLGADTIWLANDLAFDRFRTPRPELVAGIFAAGPEGLTAPVDVGTPTVNAPDVAMVDEQQLSEPLIGTPLAPVQIVNVSEPAAIVRAGTTVVVLAGSGDGFVDAAAAGLLHGDEAVLYSAALPRTGVPDGALLIATDTNRDRASHWRSSQDVTGFTESGGPGTEVGRDDDADQRLEVFASDDPAQQTTAVLDTGLVVRASAYGEPFAYRPEDRAAMAVDGDPTTAWRVADRADPVGESISLSTTDGSLVLLQQQVPAATRMIAAVSITEDGGEPREVTLDASSLTAPGQVVAVEPGVEVVVTITAIADVATGTDSGPSAVGFAELGPVATEVVRLPSAALDTVDGTRPLAIVLTRERVRATNRWRSDPEPALVRELELPVARAFDATVTLRLDGRAPDAAVDALAGTAGVAVADRRLTGVAAARAVSAIDGDPATAWTSPFGQATGSTITVHLDPAQPVDRLVLTQPVDELHSLITRIVVRTDQGEQLVDVPAPDAAGTSTVALAPFSGSTVTITVDAIEARTTVDRRYAETVELPVAIVELGGLPVAPTATGGVTGGVTGPAGDCHEGLLTVDGAPVGVALDAAGRAALVAGEAVEVGLCTAGLVLEAGTHRITATAGATTGIDVDRLTLRSAVDPTAVPAAAPQVTVHRTRTVRSVEVGPCPTGCWVILGEGFNTAWTARDGDADLGEPALVSGGFNGWWLEPSDQPRTVTMRWSPQRSLDVALFVALAGVLACVVLAAADRRVLRAMTPPAEPVFDLVAAPSSRRASLAAGILLVAGAAAFIEPRWALLALAPAVVVRLVRRPRLLALAAVAAAGMLQLIVAVRQYRLRFAPDAAWPGRFEDLHGAGLFVVVLLLAGSLLTDGPVAAPDNAAAQDTGPAQDTAAATSDPAR